MIEYRNIGTRHQEFIHVANKWSDSNLTSYQQTGVVRNVTSKAAMKYPKETLITETSTFILAIKQL